MGSYGSGRLAEQPSAEQSYALPTHWPAAALRALRQAVEPSQASGTLTWLGDSAIRATIAYTVGVEPSGPWCELRYSADSVPITDRLALVERPSNLPGVAGAVVYWRCACHQLARVLYLGTGQRWRCRRCVPVVYQSSRDSDRRVSDLLAQAAQLVRLDWGDALQSDPAMMATLSAATLARRLGAVERDLFVALKALDRLGCGIGGKHRSPRWHGSIGQVTRRAGGLGGQ